MKEIWCDKFGNLKKQNPFKRGYRYKPERKRFPSFKTYIRFGMHKTINKRYTVNPEFAWL